MPRTRELTNEASSRSSYSIKAMIYSVVPKELEDELYPKLVEYYADNPDVTVIVDRREGDRRSREGRRLDAGADQRRVQRDRRRQRASGEALPLAQP